MRSRIGKEEPIFVRSIEALSTRTKRQGRLSPQKGKQRANIGHKWIKKECSCCVNWSVCCDVLVLCYGAIDAQRVALELAVRH